jgi:hypothetical protein
VTLTRITSDIKSKSGLKAHRAAVWRVGAHVEWHGDEAGGDSGNNRVFDSAHGV